MSFLNNQQNGSKRFKWGILCAYTFGKSVLKFNCILFIKKKLNDQYPNESSSLVWCVICKWPHTYTHTHEKGLCDSLPLLRSSPHFQSQSIFTKAHACLCASEALEKMKAVYEQNADLGNPSILEPQMAETVQNIGYLRGELAKYEVGATRHSAILQALDQKASSFSLFIDLFSCRRGCPRRWEETNAPTPPSSTTTTPTSSTTRKTCEEGPGPKKRSLFLFCFDFFFFFSLFFGHLLNAKDCLLFSSVRGHVPFCRGPAAPPLRANC